MKRAIKQAKIYREKLTQLSTAEYELRNANSDFIGHSFDYTTPLYRKLIKIKGMEVETEHGYLQVLAKPNKKTQGIKLIIRTSQNLTDPDYESMSVRYQYNDDIIVSIKVKRNAGYRGFEKLINDIRKVTDTYLNKKVKKC